MILNILVSLDLDDPLLSHSSLLYFDMENDSMLEDSINLSHQNRFGGCFRHLGAGAAGGALDLAARGRLWAHVLTHEENILGVP